MQTAYIFTTLGYLISHSFKNGTAVDVKNRLPESEQKVALAFLGFTIGKYFFSYIFSKILPKLPKSGPLYVTGLVCAVTLFIHVLVASLSRHKHSPGWFFVAFFWGVQDAILSGKIETNEVNNVIEVEETLIDSYVFLRLIGALLICFLGMPLRKSYPIILLIFLMVIFLAAFALTMLSKKKPSTGESEALVISSSEISGGDSGIQQENKLEEPINSEEPAQDSSVPEPEPEESAPERLD